MTNPNDTPYPLPEGWTRDDYLVEAPYQYQTPIGCVQAVTVEVRGGFVEFEQGDEDGDNVTAVPVGVVLGELHRAGLLPGDDVEAARQYRVELDAALARVSELETLLSPNTDDREAGEAYARGLAPGSQPGNVFEANAGEDFAAGRASMRARAEKAEALLRGQCSMCAAGEQLRDNKSGVSTAYHGYEYRPCKLTPEARAHLKETTNGE